MEIRSIIVHYELLELHKLNLKGAKLENDIKRLESEMKSAMLKNILSQSELCMFFQRKTQNKRTEYKKVIAACLFI